METLYLSEFKPNKNGIIDDTAAFSACFEEARKSDGACIVIEPGEYLLSAITPVLLPSNTSVKAKDAVFLFPKNLGEVTSRTMFFGENISNFSWEGGTFVGYVYNPEAIENDWEPHTSSVCIEICRTKEKKSENFSFCDMKGKDVSGPVVFIRGDKEGDISLSIEHIRVSNCDFENCGKFMWDYGYLWQILTFSECYKAETVENAMRYMPKEQVSSVLTLKDGRLYAEFMPKKLEQECDCISFFGKTLPKGVVRGKQYFVVNSGAENGLLISETRGGEPIVLTDAGSEAKCFRNLFYVFHDLFAPVGNTSPAKGSIDLTLCKNAEISNCCISASGDSMHILECENVLFSANRITGARMGAFYIGFFCKNITATGNTVYGTNGSRVVSVERESENITITGNVFYGGGRGSWINQPKNVIISGNIFEANTKKCTPDLAVGRICRVSGAFEQCPELYFTTWRDCDADYGPVVITSNIFQTDEHCAAAIAFNPGGKKITVANNVFAGTVNTIHVASGCEMPVFSGNINQGDIEDVLFVNTANVPF